MRFSLAGSTMLAALLAAAPSSCGSRSGLELPNGSAPVGGAGDDGGGGAGHGGGGGEAGTVVDEDRCASAVSGPKAIWRNCSTRDGRSRVLAPTHPHVAWTTKLPTGAPGHIGSGYVATGVSNELYVVTTESMADKGAIRRVDAADGSIAWTLELAPDSATSTPVALSNGVVELFAYDASTKESLLEIDAKSGGATPTTFGFDLYYGPPQLAVGADGSRYLVHSENVGTATSRSFLSRVRADGTVAWTTPDLATLLASSPGTGSIFPFVVALGGADAAVTVLGVLTASGEQSVAFSFDAAGGAVQWQQAVAGQLLGGPTVRADGSIALLVGSANQAELVLLDPHSGVPTKRPIGFGVFELHAVTKDGIVVVGTSSGNGVDGLAGLDADANPVWTRPGRVGSATIASDGTVVGFGATIFALDPVSGATKWELSPPSAGSCVADAALTSERGIVGVQCDGTLFGARD